LEMREYSGLGGRKAVEMFATVRRSTSTKASTAALGPFRQRLSCSSDANRATRLAARNCGKGSDATQRWDLGIQRNDHEDFDRISERDADEKGCTKHL
jgi:hypothetical protein